jgi:integrase/recombinase XerD
MIMQLCDVADPIGLRDRAMLEVLYSTGMRRWRCRLRLYDLWTSTGHRDHPPGQGQEGPRVPIGERAVAWLDKYIREARPQLVAEPDDITCS